MEEILARAKKVAQTAEVFQVSSEETIVRFEANKLKQLQTSQSTSVALRVVNNGRIGYATMTGTGDGTQLVANAVETAEFGSEAKFQLPGKEKYPDVDIFDPAVGDVAIKDMVELGQEMITAVTAFTPGIMCDGSVSRGIITVRLIELRKAAAPNLKRAISAWA